MQFLLLWLAAALLVAVAPANAYQNPIIPGMCPDPSIIADGDYYFLVCSSFEYFPAIPIWRSKDLINWDLWDHGLTRAGSQLNTNGIAPSGGIWAVTLRKHEGKYYLTSASWDLYEPGVGVRLYPRGFIISTSDIYSRGSWGDPVYLDAQGFDQDLFWDSGKTYLSTTFDNPGYPLSSPSRMSIYLSEIDHTTGNSLTVPKIIRNSTIELAEGNHLMKIGKYYYLFTAEGGTSIGHRELVFRSTVGPYGPWEDCPHNPLVYNGASSNNTVQRTGHADMFRGKDGKWWAVLLATRPQGKWDAGSVLGRETFLVPVTWKDDWPVFNGGKPVTIDNPGLLENIPTPKRSWKETFDRPAADGALPKGWYTVRTPLKKDYSLTARPGYLRIRGNVYNLTQRATPALFLKRQEEFVGLWSATLDFTPLAVGDEAGAVVWFNEYTHQNIGVRQCKKTGGRCVYLRSGVEEVLEGDGAVELLIAASIEGYNLGYVKAGGERKWLLSVTAGDMSKAGGPVAAFTGTYWGLYATGNGLPSMSHADFKEASWTSGPVEEEEE